MLIGLVLRILLLSRSAEKSTSRKQISKFVLPEDRSQNLNDLSDRVDLNNTFEQEKNVIGVSFDLNYSRALNESTKTWVKNLLLFYKHKITLLENQNYFLLNQNNFLQHQIDQNNQIILTMLNC